MMFKWLGARGLEVWDRWRQVGLCNLAHILWVALYPTGSPVGAASTGQIQDHGLGHGPDEVRFLARLEVVQLGR